MTQAADINQISAEIPYPHPRIRPHDPLFFAYDAREPYRYLYNEEATVTLSDDFYQHALESKHRGALSIPLVMDAEFYTDSWQSFWLKRHCPNRQGVTIQCCGIVAGEDRIFDHPHHALYATRTNRLLHHTVAMQEHVPGCLHSPGGFIGVDYLRAEGVPSRLSIEPWSLLRTLPKAQFVLYNHFLLADLYMSFYGQFLHEIDKRVRAREITMRRRLLCQQKHQDVASITGREQQPPHDFVSLPFMLTLYDWRFAVELACCDTAAIHGAVSLATFCENVGITLHYKDLVKREWITRMQELYWADPALFRGYALEDLLVYEALKANALATRAMYNEQGLIAYCPNEPRATLGKNSQTNWQAMLDHACKVEPGSAGNEKRKAILDMIHRATATYLASRHYSTIRLLGKVEGGRCRCNRPTLVSLLGPLADIDISSCYGRGLAIQDVAIGTPVIEGYDTDTTYNEYLTLREYREMFGHELVPGLWHARVSLKDGYTLKHRQDFLGSWFDYKNDDQRENLMPGLSSTDDRDDPELTLSIRSGSLKILRREIRDAVITHDFFDWLDHVCTSPQRTELLDNLYVKAFLFYPKSEERPTLEQLDTDRATHTGRNRIKRPSKSQKANHFAVWREKADYHGWVRFSMGALGVDTLLRLRKKHPKGTPLNTLLKLTINALYGDSVSQYFDTSNMCIGNNITARARAMAWYMEKGLNMVQTITDGGPFELNAVVYGQKRMVNAANVVDMCRTNGRDLDRKLHLRLAPLGGYEKITLDYQTPTTEHPVFHYHVPRLTFWQHGKIVQHREGTEALQWIDETALKHLQQLFPHATVLKQFFFETKNVYPSAVFHGSANYTFDHPDPNQVVVKFRSYEKEKDYQTFEWIKDTLVKGDFYNDSTPAIRMLEGYRTSRAVPRQHAFGKSRIQKDGEYRVRYKQSDAEHILYPGDDIRTCGLPREFNLSQFHYETMAQFKAIKSQWEEYLRRYGQYVEMLYLSQDGLTLDYQQMLLDVDTAIVAGETNLMEALDRGGHTRAKLAQYPDQDRRYHPAYKALQEARKAVAQAQGLLECQEHLAEDTPLHAETSWDHIPHELAAVD